MKVTKKNSWVRCYEEFGKLKADIDAVGLRMSAEERQNITVLDFPKFVRENGKDYLVTDLYEVHVKTYFPKLKKVRIPKGAAHRYFLQLLINNHVELEEY